MTSLKKSLARKAEIEYARRLLARRSLADFVKYTKPDYSLQWFHQIIADHLDALERGEIKKLMVFVPPQHGKSELATRRAPAYFLGKNPNRKIVVSSYSATIAQTFNRDIQRVIDDELYRNVFPDTTLTGKHNTNNIQGSYLRNSEIFEVVGSKGFLKTVGRGGSLTGTPVDIGIIDDPLKDREEAQSVTIREKLWEWYTDVFESRLHNNSQQLVIQTRWDEDDLSGRILNRDSDWHVISFPALKEGAPNSIDPRKEGEALWEERHSRERIIRVKENNPVTFNSLYQQNPKPSTEALIYPNWNEVDEFPKLPFIVGIDWGFRNDPTAIIKVAIQGANLYVQELLYKVGAENPEIEDFLNANGLKGKVIIADTNEPKSNKYFRDKGFTIIDAYKPNGSVASGIALVNEHVKHHTINCHNIRKERNRCQYIMAGGVSTNIPVKGNDHTLDPLRYCVEYLKRNQRNKVRRVNR